MNDHRLPELAPPSPLVTRVTEHALAVTVVALISLLAATLLVLANTRFATTVTATAALVAPVAANGDGWQATLELPAEQAEIIHPGDRVRARLPPSATGGSGSGPELDGEVVRVAATGGATRRVELTLRTARLDAVDRDRLRRGMAVETRVIVRSVSGLELIAEWLGRVTPSA